MKVSCCHDGIRSSFGCLEVLQLPNWAVVELLGLLHVLMFRYCPQKEKVSLPSLAGGGSGSIRLSIPGGGANQHGYPVWLNRWVFGCPRRFNISRQDTGRQIGMFDSEKG